MSSLTRDLMFLLPLAVGAGTAGFPLSVVAAEAAEAAEAGASAVPPQGTEAKPGVELPVQPGAPAPERSLSEEDYFQKMDDLTQITVVSASRQEEPLGEAPVPVTVITADMIRSIGARTLQDVLLAYVPGMTLVADHNEMYSAMHGVYASAQQKILVLLNGHRLNSRAYSMADFDHSISLDRIKQIEVLRGPGSSLYGNVSLTAVINLVTKSGQEVDGATVRLGAGNYGQRTANLVVGKGFDKKYDVMAWASLFASDGERVSVPAAQDYAAVPRDGSAIIGGVRDPFSYDLGVVLTAGDFTLLGSRRFGKVTEPFTSTGVTGESFDYGSYRTLHSIGPGLGSRSNHLELKYHHEVSLLEAEVSLYYDTNELVAVSTQDPTTLSATYVNWEEDDFGLAAQARLKYDFASLGAGNLLLGTQLEGMRLLDSSSPRALGGVWSTMGGSDPSVYLLERGSEETYSGFAQLKHRWSDFIVNLGLRFDFKDRHRDPNAHLWDLSPRGALIWMPSALFDLKLSYAQAFVDAPYWYRYNSLPSYRGADTLTPEHLRSLQLTPTVHLLHGKLTNTLNVFYNHLYDFVFRNNNAAPTEPLYQNAGMLQSVGVEDELAYLQEQWTVRANATYQRLLEAKDFGGRDGEIFNVPSFSGNLIFEANPLYAVYQNVWFTAMLHYNGPQLSPITSKFVNPAGEVVADYVDANKRIPGYVLVNLGVRLTDLLQTGLSLDATVTNLLNTRYTQGGSVSHPYPQPGRWFLANLTYHYGL
ncbi:MAG: TonB-dependent receptor [Deltaproteobacteria bacterium]|nr:TonB-dependent receptor [Deltaproteobacteria bacterium]